MKPDRLRLARSLAVLLAASLAVSPVLADPPAHAGGGKGKGNAHARKDDDKDGRKERHSHHSHDGGGIAVNVYFGDGDRRVVREYFESEFRSGHCPPGLAKKNNGCLPPGQAKKWARGKVLPPDVEIYPVPPEIEVRVRVPAGHKLVRVAEDILMIAVGTNMVVDAIEDLGRL